MSDRRQTSRSEPKRRRRWLPSPKPTSAISLANSQSRRSTLVSFLMGSIPISSALRRGRRRPPSAAPTIVSVARHMPVKNLELLVEACAILRDRAIEFKCILIGDGPGRGRLEEEVRRLRLEHHIKLKGEMVRDEVLQWWRRAAVGVLSSHSEGMPISLIEAAACAVPAVATAVGGIPELVENGVTGLLVPPRDTAALADALSRIVTRPTLGRELGQAARRRAVERFSLSRQVDRLIALWEGILERSALPRAAAK